MIVNNNNALSAKTPLDLAKVRAGLRNKQGKQYWRSLEELADTQEFRTFLHSEFPQPAMDYSSNDVSRRSFLKLMGASFALAGLTSCTASGSGDEKIVPYVRAPEDVVPGKPLFFATATTLGGFASGVLVESHMGRPTKIEGNPDHPASLGATTAITQASILSLYDPDRSQVVINFGRISTWDSFLAAVKPDFAAQEAKQGAGLRLLTGTVTSPTLAGQISAFLEAFPAAKWYQHEPVNQDNSFEGSQLAFGQAVQTVHLFNQAEVVLSLDADFLLSGPASVRYARDFSSKRQVRGEHGAQESMSRLYVVESTPTATGANADNRLSLRASEIEGFTRALAATLGVGSASDQLSADAQAWIDALSEDLNAHRGQSIVIAGEHQPPVVHALVHAINNALGNVGKTVVYTETVEAKPVNKTKDLFELSKEMNAGAVEMLVVFHSNPVYDAPADLGFASLMDKVKLRVHLGLYEDETAELCHWHVPAAHFLESWGDARAYDGTTTIMQPLIEPLYEGKSEIELLSTLRGESTKGYDMVRAYWQGSSPEAEFERFWRRALHDGVVPESAAPQVAVALDSNVVNLPPTQAEEGLEIIFQADPSIWDGSLANNGWLQELPNPLTKLTWDNAALMGPTTAEQFGVTNEDVVELTYQGRTIKAPVWVLPGHPANSVTVHLGHGRKRAGQVGTGTGFNAYALRTTQTPWIGTGLTVKKTDLRYPLASTQHHHSMEGRDIVRSARLVDFLEHPELIEQMNSHSEPTISLYPGYEYNGYAWGMSVNLSSCIGCNACITACQSENNIPIVGKEEVINGREMHWMRIDHYYEGDVDQPDNHFQPVLCMHCENAPCEVVCPVTATAHDHEGLNVMVYNRCVGTRYCSDNCPYKVRRFNFFQYSDFETESLKLMRNPNVTVRSRGVMEKCTYCVQRINSRRINAEKEGRTLNDGEVVTACEAACPTNAIVFGNINDPNSRVAKAKATPLNYSLLGETNTRPRTTYLAELRNPNPALKAPDSGDDHH